MKSNLKRIWPMVALTLSVATAFAFQVDTRDWSKYTTKDGSLSLMAPKSWGSPDGGNARIQDAMKRTGAENANMAQMMKDAANRNFQLALYDFGDNDLRDGMDNMNVIIESNPGITEKMLPEIGRTALSKMPLKGKGEFKVVSYPIGKTLLYWGATEATYNSQKMVIEVLGAFFVKGDKVVTVSFATSEGGLKKKRSVFEQVLKTIKAQ